jgi:hypothetical protein
MDRRRVSLIAISATAALALPGGTAWLASASLQAAEQGARAATRWTTLSVVMPVSETTFPALAGSELAGAYCLICHSAGMVLQQPTLTMAQWQAEVDKMRTAYGAPVPTEQIEPIARYLFTMMSARAAAQPSLSPGRW